MRTTLLLSLLALVAVGLWMQFAHSPDADLSVALRNRLAALPALPLVVCRASEEPARPVPRRDQALVAQGLQGAANRRPGHPIAGAELGLGLQGAVRADVAQGDPLAQVVGDGSEPRTCH